MSKDHIINANLNDFIEIQIPKDCYYATNRTAEGVSIEIKQIGCKEPFAQPEGGFNQALGYVEGKIHPSKSGVKVYSAPGISLID